jgi:hypothetical protein
MRTAKQCETTMESRFAKVESDLLILKWMVGVLLATQIAGFSIILRLLLGLSIS